MTVALDSIPRFSGEEAIELARAQYGLSGNVSPLPSERDQNFLIDDPARGKFVLKIANRDDSPELLDFQHQAMRLLARSGLDFSVQQLVLPLSGADLAGIIGPAGDRHCVRVLRWIDGELLGERRARNPALLRSIGTGVGRVDLALRDFSHPAMHRVLQWDLRHAGLARDKAALLPGASRQRVERAFAGWDAIEWNRLRHGVIHGDANDYNVLVDADRMAGLLDFGDMVHSAVVCDLAVALAYAMLHQPDPLAAAASVIRGYHGVNPLTDAEQRALCPLVLSRLAASLCYAAHNASRNPDDPYQVITEQSARRLLERLDACPADAFAAMVDEACGS